MVGQKTCLVEQYPKGEYSAFGGECEPAHTRFDVVTIVFSCEHAQDERDIVASCRNEYKQKDSRSEQQQDVPARKKYENRNKCGTLQFDCQTPILRQKLLACIVEHKSTLAKKGGNCKRRVPKLFTALFGHRWNRLIRMIRMEKIKSHDSTQAEHKKPWNPNPGDSPQVECRNEKLPIGLLSRCLNQIRPAQYKAAENIEHRYG